MQYLCQIAYIMDISYLSSAIGWFRKHLLSILLIIYFKQFNGFINIFPLFFFLWATEIVMKTLSCDKTISTIIKHLLQSRSVVYAQKTTHHFLTFSYSIGTTLCILIFIYIWWTLKFLTTMIMLLFVMGKRWFDTSKWIVLVYVHISLVIFFLI